MMKCPVCGRTTTASKKTGRPRCAGCGWEAKTFEPDKIEEPAEEVELELPDADVVLLLARLLLGGGILVGMCYVTFGHFHVSLTAWNVVVFAAGTVVYAILGWHVAPFATLGGTVLAFFSPLRFLVVLYPGRALAWAVVGVYRFVVERRRASELRELLEALEQEEEKDLQL